jgi:hypothetical protein
MTQAKNNRRMIRAARILSVCGALLRLTVMGAILIGVGGCLGNFVDYKPDYVEVTSLEDEQGVESEVLERMPQSQLREEIERFVYRYGGTLLSLLDAIEDQGHTPEQRQKVHQWKRNLVYSLVEIGIGPDPEVALLDILVLTTLVRIESEDRLVPQVFSGDNGQEWISAVRQGERESWLLAEKVLDPEQQTTLRKLIRDWQINNPEADNISSVRFSDFAAEVGAGEIESLIQSSGLLPEVSEATRAVDEIRRTTERALFLTLATPRLARLEVESLVYDLATQSEFKEYRASLKKFSEAAVKLSAVSDQFPDLVAAERQAAVDQAMDRLFDERENIFAEIDEREDSLKELLNQIRETLVVGESLSGHVTETITTVDLLVTRLGLDKPRRSEEGFRIEDYQATLVEATVTAAEINKVLQSLERLLTVNLDKQGAPPVTWALQELEQHLERWIWLEFVALAGLVLFTAIVVVVSSLAYRRLQAKFSDS